MAARRILCEMKLISDWQAFPSEFRGGTLCVGNFDGVHLGHARMLSAGRAEADRRGCPFSIMTFDPHPSMVLRPGTIRHPLTTMAQRQEILASFGADVLIVIPTSAGISGDVGGRVSGAGCTGGHRRGRDGGGADVYVWTWGEGECGVAASGGEEVRDRHCDRADGASGAERSDIGRRVEQSHSVAD